MIKKLLVLGLLGSLNLVHAMVGPSKDYLSGVAAISTRGFVTLQQNALAAVQSQLPSLAITPIEGHLYHLTLIGFDIEIQQGLSAQDKNALRSQVQTHLENAAHDAIQKTLKHLMKKHRAHTPIILPFKHVKVFKKQVVGIFKSTEVVTKLVDTIENYFHNNINLLKAQGLITSVAKHQKIVLPHVGLAKHTAPHLFGTRIKVLGVADFLISRPQSFSSVQVRTTKTQHLPSAAAAAV